MLVRFQRKTYRAEGLRHENGWLRLELKPLDKRNSPILLSFKQEGGDSGRYNRTPQTIRNHADSEGDI